MQKTEALFKENFVKYMKMDQKNPLQDSVMEHYAKQYAFILINHKPLDINKHTDDIIFSTVTARERYEILLKITIGFEENDRTLIINRSNELHALWKSL